LDLPAFVGGSVVGEDELPVRHGGFLDGITRVALCVVRGDSIGGERRVWWLRVEYHQWWSSDHVLPW
jgi:hypothetical protein